MTDQTAALLTIINRLLASFPSTHAGSGDDTIDGYLIGLSKVPVEHVAWAAQRFLAGEVQQQHASFAPSPAQLASVAREHWYKVLDEEKYQRNLRAIPPPDVEKSPESRARVKAMVDGLVAGFAEQHRTEDAAAAKRKHDRLVKANARFVDDDDEDGMRERLGYSVGDPDGQENAA